MNEIREVFFGDKFVRIIYISHTTFLFVQLTFKAGCTMLIFFNVSLQLIAIAFLYSSERYCSSTHSLIIALNTGKLIFNLLMCYEINFFNHLELRSEIGLNKFICSTSPNFRAIIFLFFHQLATL